jgi:periplasmic divalent cation tolerance protein
MEEFLVVTTTTDSEESANAIARELIQHRFAACVQVLGPIASTYRWNDQIETAREWLCLIKTRGERFQAVEAAIRSMHSYDVPEILGLPVTEGGSDYLSWISAETAVHGAQAI